MLADARRTHLALADLPSPAYADAQGVPADRDLPLPEPEPEGDVPRLRYGHGDLLEVRAANTGLTLRLHVATP
ncbi:hypothetical protein OG730_37885 [Streptomyces sp. NBC_01298]|uniref:hypothetical protein n=1 Tax=Streptomyces sp. NBC_01298 TaxID=2903817 RepID=UPI002E0F13A8|nr:hypothetical protein OG730_37885 [Streptomyces sp. NBC_01298]